MGYLKVKRCTLLTLPLVLALSAGVSANDGEDSDGCGDLRDLRASYTDVTAAIIKSTHENMATPTEEIDLEEQGCISDYGIQGGFGLPSLADLGNLADQFCAAADSYISTQLGQFGAKLTSPLGLADLDLGIGARDPDDEGDPDDPDDNGGGIIDLDRNDNEIGFDSDKFIKDQFEKAPKVDSSYSDYNYDGGGSIDSETDYGTSKRKSVKSDGERR